MCPSLWAGSCWRGGCAAQALKKKQMIKEGKLDKYGRPNESTPHGYEEGAP